MPLQHIMVVAGEASGDQHAAQVVRELGSWRPELRFFGMGGPRLADQGVELLFGAQEISVMGITEVVPKLRRIAKVMTKLAAAAERRRPACALLVDVPDFNLRLASRLKALGIPVVYYVSPTVWAWRRGRVRLISEVVDRMLCILPFEEPFYRRLGVNARYVGNPVVEQVPPRRPPEDFRRELGLRTEAPTLALLPGSRAAEVNRMLPTLVQAARRLALDRPGLQVVIPVAAGLRAQRIEAAFEGSGLVPSLVAGRACDVLGASDVAVVKSGTAVLEAALMRRPLVVVYRVSGLSYLIARLLVRVPHVSLVNLLLDRGLLPELLQRQMVPHRIAAEASRLWDGAHREAVLAGLDELRERLGPPGAARRVAEEILALLDGRGTTASATSAKTAPS